jgi:hypothetical protein
MLKQDTGVEFVLFFFNSTVGMMGSFGIFSGGFISKLCNRILSLSFFYVSFWNFRDYSSKDFFIMGVGFG